ncbi:hypothetical protein M9H77_13040 [Catharanthus roseus]|uniref:Uncharacterized protein n=1 Tax=Catharanthus roseus TaxID=4058 RepID=A0ACC0BJ46_CATRO|nr:hypothetical protein M9H77_13040 [Catharanthus roseus]
MESKCQQEKIGNCSCTTGGTTIKWLFTITVILRLQDLRRSSCNRHRKSHVPPRNILRFFREQDVGCAVSAQKIYNIVAKIKKNGMWGRNTIEEVLCLSAQRGYTVFYRNREENKVLSDIIIAHPTSIAMIRMWPYVLIIDTTYNMPLLEAIRRTPTENNFTVATTFMCNEQATTYRWVLQQIKRHIDQNVLAKLTEMVKDEEMVQRFVNGSWNKLINKIDEEEYQRKLEGLGISSVAFGIETTNRAESEHSVLKLWLSMCHGHLDTVFLNIDSLIEGQIAH